MKPDERFFSRVTASSDGCWLWDRPKRDGYGQFAAGNNRVSVQAHRWAYEHLIAPIPDGLHIDHLCRVRHCVNPWHLEPVPLVVNVMRGEGLMARNARKSECDSGHAFDSSNTYVTPGGRRQCRACRAAATVKYQQRRADARRLPQGASLA